MNAVWFGPGLLSAADLWAMCLHFMLLSLLAVGGAITTTPEMQRWVVGERGWLTDAQFTASVALAQAAPGPNLLFVAVIGWNVSGLAGVVATMSGSLLPSSVLALLATRWGSRRQDLLAVRAFKTGMAPVVIGLLISIGWLLSAAHDRPGDWRLWLLTAIATLLVWQTRLHLLLLMGAGALLGAFGLV